MRPSRPALAVCCLIASAGQASAQSAKRDAIGDLLKGSHGPEKVRALDGSRVADATAPKATDAIPATGRSARRRGRL